MRDGMHQFEATTATDEEKTTPLFLAEVKNRTRRLIRDRARTGSGDREGERYLAGTRRSKAGYS